MRAIGHYAPSLECVLDPRGLFIADRQPDPVNVAHDFLLQLGFSVYAYSCWIRVEGLGFRLKFGFWEWDSTLVVCSFGT